MKSYEEREAEANAAYLKARRGMRNPVIDDRQKFAADTEVYIRPIYESHKIHFRCDVITGIEGTYAQLYGGESFDKYSTDIASWYDEDQLMPTNGRSIEECREACEGYFGISYQDILNKRKEANDNCPLSKMIKKMINEVNESVMADIAKHMRDNP